ncbi:MAG: PIN domain-containing protein [Methylotenera sp.]|nr:PIN domain-containing protein [Methylotenera sp.]
MNLLLDTHVALWAITDDKKLSTTARELILAPRANVWVSVASLWEIAIKLCPLLKRLLYIQERYKFSSMLTN